MADNVELDAGSGGATIRTDDDGTAHWQYVKAAFGADNTQTIVTASVGLPTNLIATSLDLMLGTDFSDVFGTSSVIGAGTEAGAVRVTLATDSTGVLSVDDNGGSLTVDNAGLTELAAAINTNRLDVNIAAQGADVTIADGGNSITVDGTVTANLGATDNAVLDQIEVNTSYGDQTGGGT